MWHARAHLKSGGSSSVKEYKSTDLKALGDLLYSDLIFGEHPVGATLDINIIKREAEPDVVGWSVLLRSLVPLRYIDIGALLTSMNPTLVGTINKTPNGWSTYCAEITINTKERSLLLSNKHDKERFVLFVQSLMIDAARRHLRLYYAPEDVKGIDL